MLDDFAAKSWDGRRYGASLAVSIALYGSIGAGVVAMSRRGDQPRFEEDLVQVALAPPLAPTPPPPPPAPPPPLPASTPASPPRLGRPRPHLEPSRGVLNERPAESDRPLAPAHDPVLPEGEGDPRGSAEGLGQGPPVAAPPPSTPPPPPPEPPFPRTPVRVIEGSTPPQFDRAELIGHFEVPAAVRSAGIARITVVVRVTVDAEGQVTDVVVLRGHPLIPEENVVSAVRATRFSPARLADGTPYAAIHTIPITIVVQL